MGKTYLEIREDFTRGDNIRDEGLTTPEDIQRFDAIRYGSDWVYGDRVHYSHYCMRLAQRGFTVVNFSYRLAPEHKYPAQLEDTCRAVKWVQEHTSEYPIDLQNIFMVGDSAGGQIGHCFHLDCRSDIAAKCNDDECAFFRAHMA